MIDDNTQDDDLRVVRRILKGDKEAYRIIVDKYKEKIYRICLSFLRSPEEAEDAAQEIFIKTFTSLQQYQQDRPFLPWLHAIAFNHLRTRFKILAGLRRKMRKLLDPSLEKEHTIQNDAETNETKNEIHKAILKLAPKYREPVILHYMEELSVKEIAEKLSLSGENVKTRLFRARQRLMDYLKKMQP